MLGGGAMALHAGASLGAWRCKRMILGRRRLAVIALVLGFAVLCALVAGHCVSCFVGSVFPAAISTTQLGGAREHAPPMAGSSFLQQEDAAASRGRLALRALGAAGGDQATTGLLIAALSSFFNGSFPACSRIPAVELDPVVFNGLVCLGVFLSSLLVPAIASVPYVFTTGGLLGGVLFVFAALFSFLAIPRCGLATAQAVWSCSAILVSFAWGAFGPSEVAAPVKDLTGSLVAVLLLVAGAFIAVSSGPIAKALLPGDEAAAAPEQLAAGADDEASDGGEADASSRVLGLLFALSVGLFGGSVLVPFKFVPPEAAGLAALPSFGLGALLAGAAVTAVYWKAIKNEPGAPAVPVDALGAGVLSGLVWNLGNTCSIVAQSPPFSLAYGLAYPILQCALFFGGLWGIFVFKEIQGNAIGVFWAGAALLAGGIVVLSQYGPGAT